MPDSASPSVPELIRGVLEDAHALIRDEVALARLELREEVSAARAAGVAFGAAAVLGVVGLVLLCVALGAAVADLFDVPTWVGYGAVALLLAGGSYVFVSRGRALVTNLRVLPKTRESVRDTMTWIQSKSSRG